MIPKQGDLNPNKEQKFFTNTMTGLLSMTYNIARLCCKPFKRYFQYVTYQSVNGQSLTINNEKEANKQDKEKCCLVD